MINRITMETVACLRNKFEAESNSELTVIDPAYRLHFRFPVQNKKNCRTPGPAYLAALPVLVIFCPLGPTNFKKSDMYACIYA